MEPWKASSSAFTPFTKPTPRRLVDKTMHVVAAEAFSPEHDPVDDDCLEYVPLSQEAPPFHNQMSYKDLIGCPWEDIAKVETSLQSSPASRSLSHPAATLSHPAAPLSHPAAPFTHPAPHHSHPAASFSHPVSATNMPYFPAAAESMPKFQPSNVDDNTLRIAKKTSSSTQGKGRVPRPSDLWDDDSSHVLLVHYEEQWNHVKKGNLRPKDWEDIVLAVNLALRTQFNVTQCRNRLDRLRKTYRKEYSKVNSTGSTPSTWAFYPIADAIWGKSPKVTGLAGGFDGESFHDGSPSHMESHDDTRTNENDEGIHIDVEVESPPPASMKKDGIVGRKVKKPRRESIGNLGSQIAASMTQFTETMKELDAKHMEYDKDLEMKRMEFELKMYEIRAKEETKRREVDMATQKEIASMLLRKDGNIPEK